MARVVIKREGGLTIEADLTFDQVKELMEVNGHGSPRKEIAPKEPPRKEAHQQSGFHGTGDFEVFLLSLNDNGKAFIRVLTQYPVGIEVHQLATEMGLNDATQVGGVTGGGLAKHAKEHSINMSDVYRSEITFPNGERRRMFYPGKLLGGK